MIPPALEEMERLLGRLRGIGRKTAQRLALQLLAGPDDYLKALGSAISALRDRIRRCSRCRGLTEADPCPLCTDPRRASDVLCVVAEYTDLLAVEQSGGFRGRYFVLHGLIAPLDGAGPKDIEAAALLDLAREGGVAEVILALSGSAEAEATAHYLAGRLAEAGVPRITRIAFGVPRGADLGFVDRASMSHAMARRHEVER